MRVSRDGAASALASALFHAPVLKAPYATLAHASRRIPGVRTLFREASDRLARRLVRSGRQFQRVPIGRLRPLFDVSDFTVKGRYFSHVDYEPGATRVLLSVLQPGHVFIDVGANSGYYTVLAAMCVGDTGRVFAFEPNPPVHDRLARHLTVNGLQERVTVADVALGDRDEDGVELFVSQWADNSGISSLVPDPSALARGGLRRDASVPVSVRRFDTWIDSAQPSRIDAIKIDVEGAELDVLEGMADALARFTPRHIICETPLRSQAVDWLMAAGYLALGVLDDPPGGIPNLYFVPAPTRERETRSIGQDRDSC